MMWEHVSVSSMLRGAVACGALASRGHQPSRSWTGRSSASVMKPSDATGAVSRWARQSRGTALEASRGANCQSAMFRRTAGAGSCIGSLFELKDAPAGQDVELRFGPTEPATAKSQWIQTVPGKGWFVYLRIYGPEAPAFDGSWKPGDFEKVG
jgi:hypothetical protein